MYLALLRQYSTWVLIGLGIALTISIVAFILAYRKAKLAPYFLWRQEAARRARRLFGLIVILLLAVGGTLWNQRIGPDLPETLVKAPSPSATPTVNHAGSTKLQVDSQAIASLGEATRALTDANSAIQRTASPTATPSSTSTPAPTHTATPKATAMPQNTQSGLEFVTFARDVTDDNEPLEPAMEFITTPGPIYAFFKYTNLSNGTEWTFTWSKDAIELTRETQPWEWGAYGQAYLFFEPPGGYDAGEYLLQVFIEDQLVISEPFTVE